MSSVPVKCPRFFFQFFFLFCDLHFVIFYHFYLCSDFFYEEIKKFDNGTAQPNLAAGDLFKFLFPIPSLAEQKRIVEIIDQMLPLCEKLGR